MRTERIEFPGATGATLSARLDLPDEGAPRAYALFAHCFTCSKDLRVIREVGGQLTDEGIALLRFDFTGLGQSEGEFADTTFTTNNEDLVAACRFLDERYAPPGLLVGHSLGGAAVLNVAHLVPSARCVAVIAAPYEPTHVRRILTVPDFDADGTAEVSIGGRPFRIGRAFLEDLERHDLDARIGALGRPLMIFHSPRDRTVGIDSATRILKAAKDPRSFVSLDRADHLLTDPEDARFLGGVLAAWAHRYL